MIGACFGGDGARALVHTPSHFGRPCGGGRKTFAVDARFQRDTRAHRARRRFVKDVRRLFTLLAVLAIASAGFSSPVAAIAQATGEPTPPPKEKCSDKKTKWQQKQCQAYNNSAPGDQYFGRQKMSYLGINNTFKDMAVESGDFTTSHSIITKLNSASEALAMWASSYPHDPDLARSYYLGVLALRKVYVQAQQELAWQYIQTIIHKFPNTYFSKQMLAAIKDGFTEHWYTDAQPCPVAGADTMATPAPAAPGPPGQPVVDLLSPPCISPPTPNPDFVTPTATPSPAPHGRNAPAPVVTNPPATPAPTAAPTTEPSASTSPAPRVAKSSAKTPAPKPSGTPVPGPNPPPP
jgi:hypothetical protein